MNYYLLIIVALIGLSLGFSSARRRETKKREVSSQIEEKNKRKAELLVFIKLEKKITNDMVEEFLEVSDTTAERYLEELEEEGVIKQVGKTGRGVYYELNQ